LCEIKYIKKKYARILFNNGYENIASLVNEENQEKLKKIFNENKIFNFNKGIYFYLFI
jgi:hypothetical protein